MFYSIESKFGEKEIPPNKFRLLIDFFFRALKTVFELKTNKKIRDSFYSYDGKKAVKICSKQFEVLFLIWKKSFVLCVTICFAVICLHPNILS